VGNRRTRARTIIFQGKPEKTGGVGYQTRDTGYGHGAGKIRKDFGADRRRGRRQYKLEDGTGGGGVVVQRILPFRERFTECRESGKGGKVGTVAGKQAYSALELAPRRKKGTVRRGRGAKKASCGHKRDLKGRKKKTAGYIKTAGSP